MAAEAITIAATLKAVPGPRQFQDVFKSVLPFSFTATEASIADASVGEGDVTVPGAALGDFVIFAVEFDTAGLEINGYVSAANTVSFTVSNNTGGALTTISTGPKVNGIVLKAGHLFDM